MLRVWVPEATVATALALAGCYGSTEPATKITFDGATLNARGTANHGQAESWFEFWSTDGGTHYQVGNQTWPAGASGPVSYAETLLWPNTNYSFRLCGNDAGGDPVCAQTRTFTTLDGDTASGRFATDGGNRGVIFAAASGPHGERVHGSATYVNDGLVKGADVDCLKVSGNRAIVGTTFGVFGAQDGDPDTFYSPTSPVSCPDATWADFAPTPTDIHEVAVHDAP